MIKWVTMNLKNLNYLKESIKKFYIKLVFLNILPSCIQALYGRWFSHTLLQATKLKK